MRDPRDMSELEAQVASDKQRYEEIERQEAELLGDLSRRGPSTVGREVKYRAEKEALADSIRKGREMLGAARSQPN